MTRLSAVAYLASFVCRAKAVESPLAAHAALRLMLCAERFSGGADATACDDDDDGSAYDLSLSFSPS